MRAFGSLSCFPLAAAFADVAAVDAAYSVERDRLQLGVCAPLGAALVVVVELDDTGGDGCGQSVIVSDKKHLFLHFVCGLKVGPLNGDPNRAPFLFFAVGHVDFPLTSLVIVTSGEPVFFH